MEEPEDWPNEPLPLHFTMMQCIFPRRSMGHGHQGMVGASLVNVCRADTPVIAGRGRCRPETQVVGSEAISLLQRCCVTAQGNNSEPLSPRPSACFSFSFMNIHPSMSSHSSLPPLRPRPKHHQLVLLTEGSWKTDVDCLSRTRSPWRDGDGAQYSLQLNVAFSIVEHNFVAGAPM
ncbi:hypothetical protein BDN67DRAFT_267125 [Paxillus ammoniavirescens]|nr:hypothetical protein BDN67DRAFT_267125 [Paxillus ammoniavirescens]